MTNSFIDYKEYRIRKERLGFHTYYYVYWLHHSTFKDEWFMGIFDSLTEALEECRRYANDRK